MANTFLAVAEPMACHALRRFAAFVALLGVAPQLHAAPPKQLGVCAFTPYVVTSVAYVPIAPLAKGVAPWLPLGMLLCAGSVTRTLGAACRSHAACCGALWLCMACPKQVLAVKVCHVGRKAYRCHVRHIAVLHSLQRSAVPGIAVYACPASLLVWVAFVHLLCAPCLLVGCLCCGVGPN